MNMGMAKKMETPTKSVMYSMPKHAMPPYRMPETLQTARQIIIVGEGGGGHWCVMAEGGERVVVVALGWGGVGGTIGKRRGGEREMWVGWGEGW